jgi:ABC-type taurine transport system substrate-binding protein
MFRTTDSSERNLSQNKVTSFFNAVKEKIHKDKDKEREIDSGLQISRALSAGTIPLTSSSQSSTLGQSQSANVRSVLLFFIQFVLS